jgi:hypothetical protein
MQIITAPVITVARVAHGNTAGAEADPRERRRERRYRAQAAQLGSDHLERNNRDPRRAEGQRQDHEHHSRNDPRLARFDGGHAY